MLQVPLSMRKRALAAVAALVGAVCGLTACAAQAGDVALPPKNEAQWVLPLDQFDWFGNSSLRDYAELLQDVPCYAKHGVEWPVPWQPVDRDQGASMSAGGATIFNATLAGQYGYHHAPRTYENADAWRAAMPRLDQIAATTPGFDDIADQCQAASRRALPLPSQDALYYAANAAAQIHEESSLAARVAEKAAVWARCMSDAGYGGMAASPDAMPPEDRVEAWQVGIPFTAAGAEEISVASADAACRSNSGWSSALYAEEWDRQAKFVSKHASKLLRIRAELAEEKRLLLDAVAKNAPARPE